MSAKNINVALTSSSDYQYTVPINCVSLAIYADNAITFSFGEETTTWSGLKGGDKEAFNGDASVGMRGVVITFNAVTTANLEIRNITYEDVS